MRTKWTRPALTVVDRKRLGLDVLATMATKLARHRVAAKVAQGYRPGALSVFAWAKSAALAVRPWEEAWARRLAYEVGDELRQELRG